jgi:hypothetical protein
MRTVSQLDILFRKALKISQSGFDSHPESVTRFLRAQSLLSFICARGGNRTHMSFKGRGILSPLRLPITPLEHIARKLSAFSWRPRRESNSRIEILQISELPLFYVAVEYFFFSISFCWCDLKNLSRVTASLLLGHSSYPNSCQGRYPLVDFTLPALCSLTRFSTFSVLPIYKSPLVKLFRK